VPASAWTLSPPTLHKIVKAVLPPLLKLSDGFRFRPPPPPNPVLILLSAGRPLEVPAVNPVGPLQGRLFLPNDGPSHTPSGRRGGRPPLARSFFGPSMTFSSVRKVFLPASHLSPELARSEYRSSSSVVVRLTPSSPVNSELSDKRVLGEFQDLPFQKK